MKRAEVFLADFLSSVSALCIWDPVTARAMSRMLSLDRLEGASMDTVGGVYGAQPPIPLRESGVSPLRAPLPPEQPPWPIDLPQDASLRQVSQGATSEPPTWLSSVDAAPRPSSVVVPQGTLAPLFPAEKTRAILSAALSTYMADGPLDVSRLVNMLSRLEPVRELPFEIAPTIRRGVQVLIDTGLGMAPYRGDVEQLVARIKSLVPRDQLRLYYFTASPSRGCAVPDGAAMKAWAPPSHGTPVFVFTDLGIGAPSGADNPATEEEWLSCAERAHVAGCALTALVPYGPRRWPRRLTRAMRIVHWDRRTTAALLRRRKSS